MVIIYYVMFLVFVMVILPWITFKIWGETNHLGLFMVLCRKSKYTRWLVWSVWGNDNWYLDNIEQRIVEWKQIRHGCDKV